jgi:CBS domain-containing protein
MKDQKIGLLPIGDKHNIAGVITDRDDITIRATAEFKDPKHTPVRDVMTAESFHCFDDQDVEDAGFMMEEKHVRRPFGIRRKRDLMGILSLEDIAARGRKETLTGYTLSKIAKVA